VTTTSRCAGSWNGNTGTIHGGDDNDTITAVGGPGATVERDGAPVATANQRNSVIHGDEGDDTITVRGGQGGATSSAAYKSPGGHGNDRGTVFGDVGNDRVSARGRRWGSRRKLGPRRRRRRRDRRL
jgi:hypothetical protein